ncbi:hypothetical protein CK489_39275 [Bradyrhizobium sp. UFLA03-84]|nr:hypothetical protein CK489_39275 [Bradyrhizobium sp. UFLA03-84]
MGRQSERGDEAATKLLELEPADKIGTESRADVLERRSQSEDRPYWQRRPEASLQLQGLRSSVAQEGLRLPAFGYLPK